MRKKLRRLKIKLNNKGSLLVEVMLTTFLLSFLSLTIASVISITGAIFRTNQAHSSVNANAMQILHYIGREIAETAADDDRIEITDGVDVDGDEIDEVEFQIPVDDGDGVTAGDEFSVNWGAYDYAGQTELEAGAGDPVDRWVQYFVENNQLKRQLLTSAKAVIANSATIVANNVEAFSIERDGDTVEMSITIDVNDSVSYSQERNIAATTFTHRVILRNSPN